MITLINTWLKLGNDCNHTFEKIKLTVDLKQEMDNGEV